jgi:hypothetical protein
MQKNFEKRRGISFFNSTTKRPDVNESERKKIAPPVGLYDPKFESRHFPISRKS